MERNGLYYCGEVVSLRSFGYGTYRFTLASNVDRLSPNVVLGLFTWSDDPEYSHRELDIEISRWGDPDNENAQFVVQPYHLEGNMLRFGLPDTLDLSLHSFTWLPDSVRFRSEGQASAVYFMQEHVVTRRIPEAGGENARMNLWLMSGRPPDSGVTEVLISKFEFLPSADK